MPATTAVETTSVTCDLVIDEFDQWSNPAGPALYLCTTCVCRVADEQAE